MLKERFFMRRKSFFQQDNLLKRSVFQNNQWLQRLQQYEMSRQWPEWVRRLCPRHSADRETARAFPRQPLRESAAPQRILAIRRMLLHSLFARSEQTSSDFIAAMAMST